MVARSCHDIVAAVACSVGLDSYTSSQSVSQAQPAIHELKATINANERYFSQQNPMHGILRLMIIQIH